MRQRTIMSRHSLSEGKRIPGDEILYVQDVKKEYTLLMTASHTFHYTCKDGEKITAFWAQDNWSDGTGGYAKLVSGGVGENEVTVEVNSQAFRGFDFSFTVYGTSPPKRIRKK